MDRARIDTTTHAPEDGWLIHCRRPRCEASHIMKDFTNKVAAITGAGSGIGRALALELARQGCTGLALCDINSAGLAATARQVQAPGVRVTTDSVDVADRAAVSAWAKRCAAGHGKVNLLFNNAGVTLMGRAEGQLAADFEWLMGINFWGVVHGTQAFLPLLRASGEGHVVNVSSVFGLMGMPGQSAYCASKFAVRGFTESLRMELELEGAPVSATCVHPGGVATGIALSARVDPAAARMNGMDEQDMRERAHAMIQVTTPESAARQILSGVQRNARRVLVGPDARRSEFLSRLLGAAYQPLLLRRVRQIRSAQAGGRSTEKTV
jgi:NAD(P)-dependent dehydrogenase (short-subunit alcohol dehydrogenase family)